MPEWIKWIIIPAAIILFFYIFFFFVILVIVLKFKKRLDDRREVLRLLLAQRKDITVALYKLVIAAGINSSISFKHTMTKLINNEIGLLKRSEIFDFAPQLEKITKAVFELADTNKALKKSEEYLQFKKDLDDLDEIKRQHIAIYNSDVGGYNYWVRFMLYRHILTALKFREKKRVD